MMQFWIAALALLALAGWMVLPTLLGRGRAADVDRAEINRDLHRKELAELDAALANGELDEPAYHGARIELERRVLESAAHADGAAAPNATTNNPRLRRLAAVIVLIAVPVSAIIGYRIIGGGPDAFAVAAPVITQAPVARTDVAMDKTEVPAVAELVDRLAQRLQSKPEDGNGWLLLARSYQHLGRTADAQAAYAQARDHGAKDAELAALLTSADTVTLASAPAAVIRGVVDISPELRAQVAADDTVFIFARASNGPPMPLAVLRKQVRDLPYEFVLDDSLAMQPQLKLSGFEQVMLGARVSRSGMVTQQPGEPRGDLGPVSTHAAQPVRLIIDQAGS